MATRRARLAAACIVLLLSRRKKRRARSIWAKKWLLRREQIGFEQTLFRELRTEDENCYKNFIRMNAEDFDYLVEKITPLIKKRDTNWRQAISPAMRLCVTLRFLATGESFTDLTYFFRMGLSTIASILLTVLKAIYDCTKNI